MSRLPFTTDDVREQCEMFGDAPLAHPLPVKDLLKMCQYIDDLEIEVAEAKAKIVGWVAEVDKWERRAHAAEARHDDIECIKLTVELRRRAVLSAQAHNAAFERAWRAEAIIDAVREYADRLVPGHMQTSLYVALEG